MFVLEGHGQLARDFLKNEARPLEWYQREAKDSFRKRALFLHAQMNETGDIKEISLASLLDSRCIHESTLDLSNMKEIELSNRQCEAEQEAVRWVNVQRARRGLASVKYNAEYSYVVRQRVAEAGYNGHNFFLNNQYAPLYAEKFPTKKKYSMVAENAWPEAFQGADGKTIGYNLQETPGRGWNHHPGHDANVLSNAAEVAVGVYINPATGAAESNEVFLNPQ